MRIAKYENGIVTYEDIEEVVSESQIEEVVEEDSLDSLLAQLNELKSKIEAKVNDK